MFDPGSRRARGNGATRVSYPDMTLGDHRASGDGFDRGTTVTQSSLLNPHLKPNLLAMEASESGTEGP